MNEIEQLVSGWHSNSYNGGLARRFVSRMSRTIHCKLQVINALNSEAITSLGRQFGNATTYVNVIYLIDYQRAHIYI